MILSSLVMRVGPDSATDDQAEQERQDGRERERRTRAAKASAQRMERAMVQSHAARSVQHMRAMDEALRTVQLEELDQSDEGSAPALADQEVEPAPSALPPELPVLSTRASQDPLPSRRQHAMNRQSGESIPQAVDEFELGWAEADDKVSPDAMPPASWPARDVATDRPTASATDPSPPGMSTPADQSAPSIASTPADPSTPSAASAPADPSTPLDPSTPAAAPLAEHGDPAPDRANEPEPVWQQLSSGAAADLPVEVTAALNRLHDLAQLRSACRPGQGDGERAGEVDQRIDGALGFLEGFALDSGEAGVGPSAHGSLGPLLQKLREGMATLRDTRAGDHRERDGTLAAAQAYVPVAAVVVPPPLPPRQDTPDRLQAQGSLRVQTEVVRSVRRGGASDAAAQSTPRKLRSADPFSAARMRAALDEQQLSDQQEALDERRNTTTLPQRVVQGV